MRPARSTLRYANRPLDLASIDAVGFDLDHTLALYDDAAVNEIAAAAARRLLVDRRGYPSRLANGNGPMETPAAARTLAAELEHGGVVKLDAGRRVLRARLGGRWLDGGERGARYTGAIPDGSATAYIVHSPFELPVLWLLEEIETLAPAGPGERPARCEDVRRMLDAAHTNGVLKDVLRADLPRFVSAIDGVAAGLARWVAAGKRLFVVTNSEPDFAPAVLDLAVGPAWRDLFEVVVTGAQKPAFFRDAPGYAPGERARAGSRARVLEGGSAARVEEILGVRANRVLFVGDNARSDIRAARDHGWRAAQVVPELAAGDDDAGDGWGSALADEGKPTWLAQLVGEHADVVCDHVGRLLDADPHAALTPAGRGAVRRESP